MLDTYLTTHKKINLKQVKYLNVTDKTIKLLEESIGLNLYDLSFGNTDLDIPPIKIYNFCASKNTNKKMKSQPITSEKRLANHISGEGFVS